MHPELQAIVNRAPGKSVLISFRMNISYFPCARRNRRHGANGVNPGKGYSNLLFVVVTFLCILAGMRDLRGHVNAKTALNVGSL